MLVDIFIAPSAPLQAPKMEPVVPNLMSGSVGSSPAKAGATVTAMAADETRKWRRLSMAFAFFGSCIQFTRKTERPLLLRLRLKAGNATWRCSIKHAVIAQRDAFAGFRIGH